MSQKEEKPRAGSEASNASSTASSEGVTFETEEQAVAAREEGVKLYNAGEYEKAAEVQKSICAFYSEKEGPWAMKTAVAALDYGLTLLACIQCSDQEQAALAGLVDNNEDLEACEESLEVARIGFDKAEKAKSTDPMLKTRQIELHEAKGQLAEEFDDEEAAIKEYEFVNALIRDDSDGKGINKCRLVGNIYSIGNCQLKNNHFAEAQETFAKAIAIGKEKDSNVPADLMQDIEERKKEAADLLERGGIEDLKEQIRQQFPDEDSMIADAEETLAEVQKKKAAQSAFVTPLPMDLRGDGTVSRSIPAALAVSLPSRDNDRSCSFIQVDATPGKNRPVNTNVVVRKKPKSEDNSRSIMEALKQRTEDERSPKKQRVEKS